MYAMPADVLFLVSCSNRKTRTPSSTLMLRNMAPGTTETRARSWLRRLEMADGPAHAAESLYAGDHWHVVRSLSESSSKSALRSAVLVCSAGYGLISASTKIRPYSATFTSGHPDSIARDQSKSEIGLARRKWWSVLSSWQGPEPGLKRSLAEVMGQYDFVLIALSPPYLDAIGDDLESALTKANPESVSIFSAGAKPTHRFAEYCIPCDSRLRAHVGGACHSLNIRALRLAVERASEGLDRRSLERRFARLLEDSELSSAPQRTPMSDEEVVGFILKALKRDPQTRPTPLLRRLRDSGRSCEQARFSALFHRLRGGSDD